MHQNSKTMKQSDKDDNFQSSTKIPVDMSTGEPSLPMTRPGTTQRLRATTELLDTQRVLQNSVSVKSSRRQEGFRESNFNVEFKAFAPSVFASVCDRKQHFSTKNHP